MGARGPAPKRSDQRRRTNKPEDGIEVTHAPGADEVLWLLPDESWHIAARGWYLSLAQSGQSRFYEPSDIATAWLLAEAISRELSPQPIVVGQGESARVEMHSLPPKGAALASWLKGMTALLATEGDRRRARIELQRPQPAEDEGDADVADLARYRDRIPTG